METRTSNLAPKYERELFAKIILISAIMTGLYSYFVNKTSKSDSIKIINVNYDHFGNFDQVHIANKSPVIAKMISVLNPELGPAKINDVAEKIHQAFAKYKIEPQIVVAIIDTESKFNHELISSTGDLSMAQVNVDIWNKEFERMNMNLIESSKLKADEAYSLEVMAQILHILKTRYGKKDRRWYARYHSKSTKHKKAYLSKLQFRLKLLEKSKLLALQ